MTLQQLLIKWNGKYCEVAGSSAVNQCVDLANAYIRDVLQLPIIEWTNAVDFPKKAGDKYICILNTPNNIPQEGDIIVWSGTVGHIAIFLNGTVNRFDSFDQNYPKDSPCHVQGHTYNNVLGWLRVKTLSVPLPFPLPTPTSPPANNLQPMHQVIIDCYRALCGQDPTTEEIDYRLQQKINTYDLIREICSGDERFKKTWINTDSLWEAIKKLFNK